MTRPLVTDDLWAAVAPRLPPAPPRLSSGRLRVPDRAALTGILFVRVTGSPGERLPVETSCGSGLTGWRRRRDWPATGPRLARDWPATGPRLARDWQAAGVWARRHRVLLDRLEAAGIIRWNRAALDPSTVPARRGARRPRTLDADNAYAGRPGREVLWRRHIAPRIARPGVDSSPKPGRHRWVVERTFA